MNLTPADLTVLQVPLWTTSVIRRGELASLYRMNGLTHGSAINRRIRELVDAGLLEHATYLARPVLQLRKPLLFHDPAQGPYDLKQLPAIAWNLEKRWTDLEMQPACVYYASKRALNIFGGVMTGGIKQPNHLTHDCQCAWLYAHYLRKDPALAGTMVSEHANQDSPHRMTVPDFLCFDSQNNPVLALEVGGFYPTSRLKSLIRDLERRQIALELW